MVARRFHKVHVLGSGGARTRARIDGSLGRVGCEAVHLDESGLVKRLGDIVVLLGGVGPRIDWSDARRLRLLQLMGAGVDALWPVNGLPADVEIANARGIHLPEMRDHALALMLAFERDLLHLLDEQRRAQWSPRPAGTLHGKTAVILGLGEVGGSIAQACAALGMRVVGVRSDHASGEIERGLEAADYAVVTLPLTRRTRGLLGADEISRLRPSAVLVVLSRGGIVDEDALDAALRAGKLRGAALDVFRDEPLPVTSPLWTAPNLFITPHVAGWVGNYMDRVLALFLENLDLLERGLPPRTRVEREREY